KLRILGIDCPESRPNTKCRKTKSCAAEVPRGKLATRRTADLAPVGARVTVEAGKGEGPLELDRYRRPLGYVRLEDGRDLGLVLVREGLCADYGWKYPHARMEQYRQ